MINTALLLLLQITTNYYELLWLEQYSVDWKIWIILKKPSNCYYVITTITTHVWRSNGTITTKLLHHYVLTIQLLLITTVMFLGVTSHYYHYYRFEVSITTITTHVWRSNGTRTAQLLPHYVLEFVLLPITTVVMKKPFLPIIQESNG